jgi:simple sugar transport system permease protein
MEIQVWIASTILSIKPITIGAVIVSITSWYILEKTNLGLRIRACGENPHAAEAMGIDVNLYRLTLTGIGGLYTGLAGAFMVVNWVGFFSREMVAGRGFVALANVPLLAILGAFIFGFFEAFATFLSLKVQQFPLPEYLSFLRTTGQNLFGAFPYIATLLTVIVIMKKVRIPRALGKPYVKE